MQNNSTLRINGQRLWQSIMAMAEIGPGQHGGSSRLALTDEDKLGRDLFTQWCSEARCTMKIDDMGNLFARRAGTNNNLPPIAAGSHLDTQPHGGKFDGVYGVLSALEVVRTLNDNNIATEAPIEVVVWTNEEGSRFAPAMVASGVYAGLLDKKVSWATTDVNGCSIKQELKRIGYFGEEPCGEHRLGALLEAHIEQGPILENNQKQIGVVLGGQGIRWYDLTIKGQDAHAGPTPMAVRQDALVAAAELISGVQTLALSHPPYAVATVGEMRVSPNSRNTIPGEVFLTVDLRNPNNELLELMNEEFRDRCAICAKQHNVEIEITEIWNKPPIRFDTQCVTAISEAVQAMGYSHQEIVSGAGHDACQVCEVLPTAMIFVPCAGGLSHNEAESAEPADLEAGANVLLHAMLSLANK
ncbi:MAG: N-carbamoyl-L-amino-acid hydrolase [Saprospiraceae bacterium]|jgi:N-carbamoyl-L-amino-acid hydrolase